MSQKPNASQGPEKDPMSDSSAEDVPMSDEDMKSLDEEMDDDDEDASDTTTWRPKQGAKTKIVVWIILAVAALCVIGVIVAAMMKGKAG
jgi:hypothetical protein